MEALWSRVQAAAESHGPAWLQAQLENILGGGQGGSTAPLADRRARRSRPPERFSPDPSPRVRRRDGSPVRDPLAGRSRRKPPSATARSRRNPRRGSGAPEVDGSGLGREPGSRVERAASSGDVPVEEAPLRRSARRRGEAYSAASGRASPAGGRRQAAPGRHQAASPIMQGSAPSSGGMAGGRQQAAAGRHQAASFTDHGPTPSCGEERINRESGSSSDEDPQAVRQLSSQVALRSQRPASPPGPSGLADTSVSGEASSAAGAVLRPVQPGEWTSSVDNLRGPMGGPVVDLERVIAQVVAGVRAAIGGLGDDGASVAGVAVGQGPVGPVAAWVGPSAGAAGGQMTPPVHPDGVRLADSARGEMYVCFEGPLGAHLKKEVRERIWKDEYVEIFSLLPLEKFNLERGKADESKKEEEEKRRYRLIPRTFQNWLQAFAILASVIGERAPEHCSSLFCYMDSIGEAHRVYGGVAWLRYDEQFRQRRACRPGLRWDHKDISLWMRLMSAPRAAYQPFRGEAGSTSGAIGLSAAMRKGCCWLFNESHCRFGSSCKYKHECTLCGGQHGSSKCLKKSRGAVGEAGQKGNNPGEGGRDGAVFK